MAAPWLSVIVPAWRAELLLPVSLAALRRAAAPPDGFELIVVDDGSGDATADVAERFADRVIRLDAPSGGPSRARNAGAAAAAGEWLLFVDADVRIHPDALLRFRESVARHPQASAIFGTYDATPAAPGFISQYRNLLHRWFHLTGAGSAETFWAGLGGVRADVFHRAGGFDAVQHPRQLEDVELGYRMREMGAQLVLDPSIEGTHLKAWSFPLMSVTDFRDRGLTWMRLVLSEGRLRRTSLNLKWQERARVLLAGAVLLATLLALIAWSAALGLTAAGLTAALLLSSLPVYAWFARQKGWRFALAVVPLHLWYYFSNAAAAVVGLLAHVRRRLVPVPGPSHV
jgi:glycosyltransferase involved in cell wall biosynthesis